LAVTVTGSLGPFGEFPMSALVSSTHLIVEFVAPGTSDEALTETSVSGESVKLTLSGVPLVQLAAALTVTSLDAVSIEYPLGADVSVTV